MVSFQGVSNRQAKRWMKRLYRPGMTIPELAEQGYSLGAVDSLAQALSLAADIVARAKSI